jgi:cyclophilin family peptidyl-prolyl cis-trans isomerase
MKAVRLLLFLLGFMVSLPLRAATPQVEFQTSFGNFVIELYPDKAPKTVDNFMEYVNSGFYEHTLFHRVMERFVVQGGGFSPDMKQKKTLPPIPNEANNGLKNERGTVAMARRFEPDTAAAEFFINLADNKHLNYYRPQAAYMGYCVFGRVIRGMDVVEKISHAPTLSADMLHELPRQNIVIEKVAVLETPLMVSEQDRKPEALPPEKIINSAKKGKKRG